MDKVRETLLKLAQAPNIAAKLEYLEKTIDLSQVTDKLYHIMLY
jgi:mannose/fructose/N-acetylgalactosamine-specific phosphotransferase system component IIB